MEFKSSSLIEFRFQMNSNLDETSLHEASPADELIYKGKLLPLRLQVHDQIEEKKATTTPRASAATTPYMSCNASPAAACFGGGEIGLEDFFYHCPEEVIRPQTPSFVLALLSTAAVVYSVASIYTARRDLTFRKVLAVVPRVWRRLMSTFLWAFLILFALHSLAVAMFIAIIFGTGNDSVAGPLLVIFVLIPLYLAALVYISVVWHLASVISVLEEARGLESMRRSRLLIKGKLRLACVIFVKLNVCFGLVEWGFRLLLTKWSSKGAGLSLLLSLVLLLLLGLVILFALAVQTVVYFVCKSYHHESIDKTILADHLEAYMGEYVPLKSQDVQMEQLHV